MSVKQQELWKNIRNTLEQARCNPDWDSVVLDNEAFRLVESAKNCFLDKRCTATQETNLSTQD